MTDELAEHVKPLAPNGMPWQHYLLTLGGTDRRPFETFTDKQRQHVELLGQIGWELVGLTTLGGGSLMLAFKRPWPVGQEGQEPSHVGVYL